MSLNSDQITRLQRGLDLARQAQNEIANANLSTSSISNSSDIINGLSTAVSGLKTVLDQNTQQTSSTGRGAGR
jgi:hypothetical protein